MRGRAAQAHRHTDTDTQTQTHTKAHTKAHTHNGKQRHTHAKTQAHRRGVCQASNTCRALGNDHTRRSRPASGNCTHQPARGTQVNRKVAVHPRHARCTHRHLVVPLLTLQPRCPHGTFDVDDKHGRQLMEVRPQHRALLAVAPGAEVAVVAFEHLLRSVRRQAVVHRRLDVPRLQGRGVGDEAGQAAGTASAAAWRGRGRLVTFLRRLAAAVGRRRHRCCAPAALGAADTLAGTRNDVQGQRQDRKRLRARAFLRQHGTLRVRTHRRRGW